MKNFIENSPNAGKLISSLRDTGYNSYSAILDIIDNSIDAGAKKIDITISKQGTDFNILIADNGMGMSEEILDQALRLGSDTEKSEISDLGKYGMGLCTASISMGKKLEVTTKQSGGNILYSSQDLDHIVTQNKFEKELRRADDTETLLFNTSVSSEHGTLVKISHIDHISNSDVSQFANMLTKKIGETFRRFIDSGSQFYVNGKQVSAIDPLMCDVTGTEIYSDEEYSIKIGEREEKIGVKIVLLPEYSQEKNVSLKINMHNQLFYVMRNNRQIEHGATLGLFTKHNAFNRIRVELSFTASLDKQFGVRFSKDGVYANQVVSDFLKNNIVSQIISLRRRVQRAKINHDPEMEVNHSETEDNIAKKSKLLSIPKNEVSKKSNTKKTLGEGKLSQKKSTTRTNSTKSKEQIGAEFLQSNMGKTGALYECEQVGKKTHITWNVDHPFYERVILQNKDNKDIVTGIDYLIFSLATAELKTLNEENSEMIDNIKTIMSSNLRVLCS